jgi:hypothetical protein
MITGIIAQAAGTETKGGRVISAAANTAGSAATFGGLAAQIMPNFGPAGIIAGAGLGILTTLPDLIESFTDSLPELQKQFDLSKERLDGFISGLQNYTIEVSKFQDILGDPKSKPADLIKSQSNINKALNAIPDEFKSKVAAAALDTKKLGTVLAEVMEDLGQKTKALQTEIQLKSFVKQNSGITTGFQVRGEAFTGEKGKQNTKEIVGYIQNLLPTDFFTGQNSEQNLAGFENVLNNLYSATQNGNVSASKTQKSIEEFSRFLEANGVDAPQRETITKGILNNGFNQTGQQQISKELLNYVKSVRFGRNATLELTKAQKEQKNALDDLDFEIKKASESLNNAFANVESILQNAVGKVGTKNEVLNSRNSFNRSFSLDNIKGLLQKSRPFLGDGKAAKFESQVEAADIKNQNIDRLQALIQDSQSSFLNLIGKSLGDEAKTVIEASLKQGRGENLGPKELQALKTDKENIKNLGIVFADIVKQISDNPSTGTFNPQEFIKIIEDSTLNSAQKNDLTNQLVNLSEDQRNKLTLLVEQNNQAIKIQQQQSKLQEELIIIQQRLSVGGGAEDLLGGSKNIGSLKDISQNLFTSQFVSNKTQKLDVGRSALQFGDFLRNNLKLPAEKLPPTLLKLGASGIQENLNQQLNTALSLGENTLGPEEFKAFEKEIQNLRDQSGDIASEQLKAQLKLDNLPSVVDEINKELSALAKFQKSREDSFGSTVREAMLGALNDSELSTDKAVDNVYTAIQDLTKISEIINTKNKEKEALTERNKAAISNKLNQDTLKNAESTLADTFDSIKPTNKSNALDFTKNLRAIKQDKGILNPNDSSLTEFLDKLKVQAIEARDIGGVDIKDILKEIETYKTAITQASEASKALTIAELDLAKVRSTPVEVLKRSPKFESIKPSEKFNLDDFLKLPKESEIGSLPGTDFNYLAPIENQDNFSSKNTTKEEKTSAKKVSAFEEIQNLTKEGNSIDDILRKAPRIIKELNSWRTQELQDDLGKANAKLIQLSLSGKDFSDSILQARQNVNELKAQLGTLEFKDIAKGFADSWKYTTKDLYRDISNNTIKLGLDIKSSFKESFMEFIRGSKNAEDAFRGFALTVLDKITEMTTSMAMDSLFSGIQKGVGSLFKGTSTGATGGLVQANQGGYIQKFALGGKVKGGSGVRDDVPAMLSNGEYVIRKDAVKTIGEPILKKINNLTVNGSDINRINNIQGRDDLFSIATYDQAGSIGSDRGFKGLFKQEFQYLDKKGNLAPVKFDKKGNRIEKPVKGRLMYNRNLSTFALTDENNPLNTLRENRETTLASYLDDKRAYDKQKKDAMKAFKKAKTQRLIGAAISAVSQIAGSAIQGGGQSSTFGGKNAVGDINTSGPGGNNNVAFAAIGGPIKSNDGNSVDKIPALLTGGEFVMNRQAVKSYGVDFFNKINKFADGGFVGKETTSNIRSNDSIERLISSIDNLSASKSEPVAQTAPVTSSQGNVTVNVTVNNGNVTSETKSNKKDDKENDMAKSKEFADAIKSVVLKEILKQQKDGGLLPRKT